MMKKRTIALLLSLILSLGLLGAAYADDGDWYWSEDGIPVQSAPPETTPPAPGGPSYNGGGGGYVDPSYNVGNGSGSSPGGSWSVDKPTARENDLVIITVTPDPGMAAETPEVSGPKGESILVRELGNGTFGFTMPDGAVIVTVKFSSETPADPFVDVLGDEYYYDAVLWAVANGITTGTDSTHFSPGSPCTRAQIVTFLWRAAGSPAVEDAVDPFTDIVPGSYYYDAVLWAVSEGIAKGTTATTFSPNAACTRAQAVTFLYRAAGSPAVEDTNSPFTDLDRAGYYRDAVLWAVSKGITNGVTATTFAPKATCTRAQIVTFLYRDRTAEIV